MKLSIATIALAAATVTLSAGAASAQDRYMGEIFATAATYCPEGTWEAKGQTMAINQHQAMYALLGTQYGGNGQTTFDLPDLSGRAMIGASRGSKPGAIEGPAQGANVGAETVTLTSLQLPVGVAGVTPQTQNNYAAGQLESAVADLGGALSAPTEPGVSVGAMGASAPIDVRDPAIGMKFCIVHTGYFPTRP